MNSFGYSSLGTDIFRERKRLEIRILLFAFVIQDKVNPQNLKGIKAGVIEVCWSRKTIQKENNQGWPKLISDKNYQKKKKKRRRRRKKERKRKKELL